MPEKILFVARDAGPSGCFELLAPVLEEKGLGVELILGKGSPITMTEDEISSRVLGSDLLVLGMSSDENLAQPEIFAASIAKKHELKYGFYGDVRGCWRRAREGAWFNPFAFDTSFYLGLTGEDASGAISIFPNAEVFGTGNPVREKMAFPRFTREEIRKDLGVERWEKCVLVAGGKLSAGNMAQFVVTMEALHLLRKRTTYYFKLILTTHPGDRARSAVEPETGERIPFYEDLVSLSPVPTTLIDKKNFATTDLVPGADILIEFGSSVGFAGAYRRIPVISLGFEPLYRMLEEEGDTRRFELEESGLSELVTGSPQNLAVAIEKLLHPDGFQAMRSNQERLCTIPKKEGLALRKMDAAIEKMLGYI